MSSTGGEPAKRFPKGTDYTLPPSEQIMCCAAHSPVYPKPMRADNPRSFVGLDERVNILESHSLSRAVDVQRSPISRFGTLDITHQTTLPENRGAHAHRSSRYPFTCLERQKPCKPPGLEKSWASLGHVADEGSLRTGDCFRGDILLSRFVASMS